MQRSNEQSMLKPEHVASVQSKVVNAMFRGAEETVS